MNDLPLENLKKNPGHSILLALMTIDILANPLNIYPQPHGRPRQYVSNQAIDEIYCLYTHKN